MLVLGWWFNLQCGKRCEKKKERGGEREICDYLDHRRAETGPEIG